MYQSTILGTSVRPRAPPNAVPRQERPVTNWNGRVEISLTGSRDSDDATLSPAFVTALQGLAHHIDVTNALEAVVDTTSGHLDEVINDVIDFARVNKIGHTKLTGEICL